MSEEPDIGDYEEYVLSGIEDNASEEVAQKYEEIERPKITHAQCCGEIWNLEHVKRCLKCDISLSYRQHYKPSPWAIGDY